MLRGAQVLRLQAGLSAGRGVSPALPAHEEQLRVHQEENLPTHTPAGKVLMLTTVDVQHSLFFSPSTLL